MAWEIKDSTTKNIDLRFMHVWKIFERIDIYDSFSCKVELARRTIRAVVSLLFEMVDKWLLNDSMLEID